MAEAEANDLIKGAEKACVARPARVPRAIVHLCAAHGGRTACAVLCRSAFPRLLPAPAHANELHETGPCRENKKTMFGKKKPDWEKAADCYQKAALIYRSTAVRVCVCACMRAHVRTRCSNVLRGDD